jgi:hypothetical protein
LLRHAEEFLARRRTFDLSRVLDGGAAQRFQRAGCFASLTQSGPFRRKNFIGIGLGTSALLLHSLAHPGMMFSISGKTGG